MRVMLLLQRFTILHHRGEGQESSHLVLPNLTIIIVIRVFDYFMTLRDYKVSHNQQLNLMVLGGYHCVHAMIIILFRSGKMDHAGLSVNVII